MFGASYLSSKITPVARIWAAYTLRGRRYRQIYLWFSLLEKNPIKIQDFHQCKNFQNFTKIPIFRMIRGFILVIIFEIFASEWQFRLENENSEISRYSAYSKGPIHIMWVISYEPYNMSHQKWMTDSLRRWLVQ